MKQVKRDRRSERSRQLIRRAMLELLFETRFEEITVQAILDRANVGRSTFYTHYYDKEDVLAHIAAEQLETLAGQLVERGAGEQLIPSLELFHHVQGHAGYFRALQQGQGRRALWDAAQAALSRTIEQALLGTVTEYHDTAVPPEVAAQYLAGALLNLVRWWLEADMPYTPETMDCFFQQLALPGVRPLR
jgi:AcrR family transcriptional regulator